LACLRLEACVFVESHAGGGGLRLVYRLGSDEPIYWAGIGKAFDSFAAFLAEYNKLYLNP
ncbi:MAG: hypothetical protein Q6370_009420, partial [Candidatus Sigynarchaeota archaeon]